MNNKISCKNKTSYVYKATQNLNTDVGKYTVCLILNVAQYFTFI